MRRKMNHTVYLNVSLDHRIILNSFFFFPKSSSGIFFLREFVFQPKSLYLIQILEERGGVISKTLKCKNFSFFSFKARFLRSKHFSSFFSSVDGLAGALYMGETTLVI